MSWMFLDDLIVGLHLGVRVTNSARSAILPVTSPPRSESGGPHVTHYRSIASGDSAVCGYRNACLNFQAAELLHFPGISYREPFFLLYNFLLPVKCVWRNSNLSIYHDTLGFKLPRKPQWLPQWAPRHWYLGDEDWNLKI